MRLKSFLFTSFLLLGAFYAFGQADEIWWWQDVKYLVPKSATFLFSRASESSEVVARVYPGMKLPVSYGKTKLIVLKNGKIGEEKWYEVCLVKEKESQNVSGPSTIFGWIKASEVEAYK